MTPPATIQNIRRNIFGYADEEIRVVCMEGENVTRNIIRATLEPALERASRYCSDEAPFEHLRELFVDADEIPMEADDDALASGKARAPTIQNFGIMPTISA